MERRKEQIYTNSFHITECESVRYEKKPLFDSTLATQAYVWSCITKVLEYPQQRLIYNGFSATCVLTGCDRITFAIA